MTTIVAVRKGRTACIAADTLARYGDAKESSSYIANHDKLVRVGDAWLAPTGPASAQLVLRSYFAQKDARADFDDLQSVFETVVDMHAALKEDYFLNPKEDERDSYESSQMELMVVSPAGLFGVYPLRSVQEYTRFYAFGSGAEYALGAMHVCYGTFDDPVDIARRAIEAAAEFDSSTSLPFTFQRVTLG